MKCPKCGASESDEKAQYCAQCGEAMADEEGRRLKEEMTQEIISPVSDTMMDVIATRSSITAGDHVVVDGETVVAQGKRNGNSPARMDVVATRSKVAGRDIVDVNGGTYVAEVNINVGAVCDDADNEFYLVMVDKDNNEQSFFVCGKGEVRRKEKTWEVMLYDGRKEVSLGVEDSTISSKKGHLYLISKNGRIMCRDLGSRNGTYLNGKRVKDRDEEASPGDLIRVGSSLTFRLEKEQGIITVKKNSITPISKELADKLEPDLVIHKSGRLFLNGTKIDEKGLDLDGTRVRLEDSDFKKSIHMNRELLGLDLPDELVRALIKAGLESSGKCRDKQIDDLSRQMDGSVGKDKEQLQKNILDRLGDLNET